jgi:tetratricopeptide (TPR) repeat protein
MSAQIPAIAEAVRERRLIVFCGAGVSMLAPSRSPSWWEIYVSASRALAERLIEAFPEVAPDLRVDELLKPMTTQQVADLIFSRFAGATFSELLKVVDIADANENHRALATLAKIGGLRAAITTNFDTLIERAAAVRGVRFAIAAPGIPALQEPDDHALLVKLHGTTVEPASMIETTSQKARDISATLRAAWRPTLPSADLLVVGYSGADLNFGATRDFFADVLAIGGRIWWLYRPGSQPTLTSAVAARTTLIEGHLPDLLRELVAALGETDYSTPVTGRDAQAALHGAMQVWSHEVHIGAWSAASFYLSLCRRSAGNKAADSLLTSLLQIARKQLPLFEPGSSLDIKDLAVAGFLDEAGMHLLQHAEAAEAMALLRASVNIYNAVDHLLDGAKGDQSYGERHMNLSSSWNNYAQACLGSGETAKALQGFGKALEHAYLAGKVDSFLISLGNLLHYGFELRHVRRSRRIAESAVALADRVGAIQSSIELRLHLALYACDRNEIWQASHLLEEACRRAVAVGNRTLQDVAKIQLGECAIRSGRIAEGLAMIAAVVSSRPGTAFLFRPVEETRLYLKTLGIEQPVPFSIQLEPTKLPELAARIEAERAAARQNQSLPWGGAHCAISESSHLGRGDGAAMVQIGCLEFEDDTNGATEEGLKLAEYLVSAELTVDATWVAQNVLARPAVPALSKARALAVLTHCDAASGRIDEARQHLENARLCYATASVPLPATLAEVGLWLAVQLEDASAALPWAEGLADDLSARPQGVGALMTLVAQIESWGSSMKSVALALRQRLSRVGLDVPTSTNPHSSARFRRFPGVTASTEPGNKPHTRGWCERSRRWPRGIPKKLLCFSMSLPSSVNFRNIRQARPLNCRPTPWLQYICRRRSKPLLFSSAGGCWDH